MTTEERLAKVERKLDANKIMLWRRRIGGGAMKQMAFLLTIGMFVLALGACAARAAEGQEPAEEIAALHAENNMLKRQRTDLLERVKSLEQEVERLKAMLKNAGMDPETVAATALPEPDEPPKTETYMYLGKPRSKVWFDQMFKRFADKIVRVDGKYLDVGKAIVGLTDDQPVYVPEMGTAGEAPSGCRVMQVIGKDEILIRLPGWSHNNLTVPDTIFHVKGVDTKNLVDGAMFKANLVCIGTYHYVTTTGAGGTIPSCAVHTPLTKEQFAEALAGGLQLVSYRRVEQKKPGGEREFKAVGTPVP